MPHVDASRGKRGRSKASLTRRDFVAGTDQRLCYTLRWCNTGAEDISLRIIIGCAISINPVTQAQL
jgi:hypothetical protein